MADFWNKDDPVLDETGQVVRGGMWEPQRRWWGLANFVKAFIGGYGAGKTLIGCKRIIALALLNNGCPVATVSPTFPMARETVIVTISELLAGKQSLYPRGEFKYRYNATTHTFHIEHRGRVGRIICYSGENPRSLKGPNLAAVLLDEPFLMDVAVYNQMIARIRHPKAVKKELLLTGTPEELNWGYDLCMGTGQEVKKQDVGVVFADTRQNKALGTDYVDRLLATLTEKAAKAFVEGKFVNLAEGLVFYTFSDEHQVKGGLPVDGEYRVIGRTRKCRVPAMAEIGAGWDFNVNPMCVTLFWRLGDYMHYFDEWRVKDINTEGMADRLVDEYGDDLQIVYPDATGKARKTSAAIGVTDLSLIRAAGFEVVAPNRNVKLRDSFNAVNGKFELRGKAPSLTIDPARCPHLTKALTQYTYDKINKKEGKTLSHIIDAFRYPPTYLYPIDKRRAVAQKFTGA